MASNDLQIQYMYRIDLTDQLGTYSNSVLHVYDGYMQMITGQQTFDNFYPGRIIKQSDITRKITNLEKGGNYSPYSDVSLTLRNDDDFLQSLDNVRLDGRPVEVFILAPIGIDVPTAVPIMTGTIVSTPNNNADVVKISIKSNHYRYKDSILGDVTDSVMYPNIIDADLSKPIPRVIGNTPYAVATPITQVEEIPYTFVVSGISYTEGYGSIISMYPLRNPSLPELETLFDAEQLFNGKSLRNISDYTFENAPHHFEGNDIAYAAPDNTKTYKILDIGIIDEVHPDLDWDGPAFAFLVEDKITNFNYSENILNLFDTELQIFDNMWRFDVIDENTDLLVSLSAVKNMYNGDKFFPGIGEDLLDTTIWDDTLKKNISINGNINDVIATPRAKLVIPSNKYTKDGEIDVIEPILFKTGYYRDLIDEYENTGIFTARNQETNVAPYDNDESIFMEFDETKLDELPDEVGVFFDFYTGGTVGEYAGLQIQMTPYVRCTGGPQKAGVDRPYDMFEYERLDSIDGQSLIFLDSTTEYCQFLPDDYYKNGGVFQTSNPTNKLYYKDVFNTTDTKWYEGNNIQYIIPPTTMTKIKNGQITGLKITYERVSNINGIDTSPILYSIHPSEFGMVYTSTVNIKNDTIMVNVEGETVFDDDTGTFDNAAGTLASLGNFVNTFDDTDTNRDDWRCGLQLTEQKTALSYIKDISKDGIFATFWGKTGNLTGKSWIENYDDTPTYDFTQYNIIENSVSDLSETNLQDLSSEFSIKYSYNPGNSDYEKETFITNVDASDFPDEFGNGIREIEPYIIEGASWTGYTNGDLTVSDSSHQSSYEGWQIWSTSVFGWAFGGGVGANQWVKIELDKPIAIYKAEFENNGLVIDAITGFRLEASNNDIDWDVLYTGDTIATYGDTPEEFIIDDDTLTQYLYYRFYITAAAANGGLSYFQIYEIIPPVIPGNWKDFVGGIDDYDLAKILWERCQTGYNSSKIKNKLSIESKWIQNPELMESEVDFVGIEDRTDYKLLDNLTKWVPYKKKYVSFNSAITEDILDLDILDLVTFKHEITTGNLTRRGYITGIQHQQEKRQIRFSVMFADFLDTQLQYDTYIDMGEVVVSASELKPLTFYVLGLNPVTITHIELDDGTQFDVSGPTLPIVVDPGGSETFDVEFTPLSLGEHLDEISLTAVGMSNTLVPITLRGFGVARIMDVIPDTTDFGDIPINGQVTKSINFHNNGNSDIEVTDITFTDVGFSPVPDRTIFTVPAGTGTVIDFVSKTLSLPPGGETPFDITYTITSNQTAGDDTFDCVGRYLAPPPPPSWSIRVDTPGNVVTTNSSWPTNTRFSSGLIPNQGFPVIPYIYRITNTGNQDVPVQNQSVSAPSSVVGGGTDNVRVGQYSDWNCNYTPTTYDYNLNTPFSIEWWDGTTYQTDISDCFVTCDLPNDRTISVPSTVGIVDNLTYGTGGLTIQDVSDTFTLTNNSSKVQQIVNISSVENTEYEVRILDGITDVTNGSVTLNAGESKSLSWIQEMQVGETTTYFDTQYPYSTISFTSDGGIDGAIIAAEIMYIRADYIIPS